MMVDTMRTSLKTTLAAATLATAVSHVGVVSPARAAAAGSTLGELRRAMLRPGARLVADLRYEAVAVRDAAAPAPAMVSDRATITSASNEEPAAVTEAADQVTQAPLTRRARGPPLA